MRELIRLLAAAALVICFAPAGFSQAPAAPPSPLIVEQPDAERTRGEMYNLLNRYPPSVRTVIGIDPGLLNDETWLGQYPALATFLRSHPEVERNPGYYADQSYNRQELWYQVVHGTEDIASAAMALGLLVWLIRTIVDYRRWNRLTRVQTEVHTKLLDRFTGNDELLNYMNTPAGAKFLESTPIRLDQGPKSVSAPMGRILWSMQCGVIILCAGIGFVVISGQISTEAIEPIRSLGMLGIAVGAGFVISAGVSFLISQRMGLLEKSSSPAPEGMRQT